MDISVPPKDCAKLDRIWEKARPYPPSSEHRHAVSTWKARRIDHLRLNVWRGTKGPAASNGHRRFTSYGSMMATGGEYEQRVRGHQAILSGIDVMCIDHQSEYTLPGGKRVDKMANVIDALIHNRVRPVEFGPTTIPLVAPSLALEYVKARRWDTACGDTPPLSLKAKAALAAYSSQHTYRVPTLASIRPGMRSRRRTPVTRRRPGIRFANDDERGTNKPRIYTATTRLQPYRADRRTDAQPAGAQTSNSSSARWHGPRATGHGTTPASSD